MTAKRYITPTLCVINVNTNTLLAGSNEPEVRVYSAPAAYEDEMK